MNDVFADVVRFLAPFVPFLVAASEEAAEEASRRFGADAWEGAKRVWGRLGSSRRPDEQTWEHDLADALADPAEAGRILAVVREAGNVGVVNARTVGDVVTGTRITLGSQR